MSKITKILNDHELEIKSADYQTHKIYNVLENADIELGIEQLEEIIGWMNENDLLGVSDAYEDLNALKYDVIFERLQKELDCNEEIAHKRFHDEEWTLESRFEHFLELSAMIKIFRALSDLQETTIIKIDEEMELNLSYFVNHLANDYNNYNISPKEVYDFIHSELNKDEEPERHFIITKLITINGKEVEQFITIEKGVTAQHAFQKVSKAINLLNSKVLVKNMDNETLIKKQL
jgi:hypothetical protein